MLWRSLSTVGISEEKLRRYGSSMAEGKSLDGQGRTVRYGTLRSERRELKRCWLAGWIGWTDGMGRQLECPGSWADDRRGSGVDAYDVQDCGTSKTHST